MSFSVEGPSPKLFCDFALLRNFTGTVTAQTHKEFVVVFKKLLVHTCIHTYIHTYLTWEHNYLISGFPIPSPGESRSQVKSFAFTLITVRCVESNLSKSRIEEPPLQTQRHACFTHVTQTQNQETHEFWERESESVVELLCVCVSVFKL